MAKSSNTRGAGRPIETERGHRAQDVPATRKPLPRSQGGDGFHDGSKNEPVKGDDVQWR